MKNLLKYHTGYYLSLGAMMLLCMTLIMKTTNEPRLRVAVICLTSFIYVFWGIAHHIVHHDISLKVVLEYVLIGIIGTVLVLLVIA
jgi:hypothetical protein